MTLRKLLNDAMLEARQPISDPDFIRWYNDCLRDLARRYDTAKMTEETIIADAVAEEWNALTAGNIGIIRVEGDEGFAATYQTRDGAEIRFPYDGTYTVFERLPQEPVDAMSDTPTLSEQYDDAVVAYVVAKSMQNTSPELSALKMQEYKEQAEMANRTIRASNHRNAQVAAPEWP